MGSSASISRAARRRSRTPTPPERSSGGGRGAPERDERLDAAQEVERGPARGPVDGVGAAVADVQRRRVERRASRAAGRRAARARPGGAARRSPGRRAAAAPWRAAGRPGRSGRAARLRPIGGPAARASSTRRSSASTRRAPAAAPTTRPPPPPGARGRRGSAGRRRARPGRARYGPLAGRVRPRVPHQGAGAEGGQRGVEGVGGHVGAEQPGHLGARDGRLVGVGDDERLQRRRGSGCRGRRTPGAPRPARPRGWRARSGPRAAARSGRAQPDERGERRVVLGAQPVDQRGGHQIHGSLCANSDAEEEDHVAKRDRPERIDPTWPHAARWRAPAQRAGRDRFRDRSRRSGTSSSRWKRCPTSTRTR